MGSLMGVWVAALPPRRRRLRLLPSLAGFAAAAAAFFAGAADLAAFVALVAFAALAARGGGSFGTGIGSLAAAELRTGLAHFAFFAGFASRVARRLVGPRTGVRGTNTQPTCGTGLPPINRPSSKSHSYEPWNSWN